MTEQETPPDQTADLRRQAEEIVREEAGNNEDTLRQGVPIITRQDVPIPAPTLHELRVHQIELEIQNEEMRRMQRELEAARARYFDLYDLAPVGYCTVSEKGLILEANLTAATLLGLARGKLVRQQLAHFIIGEDQEIFYLHRKELLATAESQVCELRMVQQNGAQFWARMETTASRDAKGEPMHRVLISDITLRKMAEEGLQRAHNELEQRVATRTEELRHANEELQTEVAERKRVEDVLSAQSEKLEQTNTALQVLLRHQAEEMRAMERKIVANIQRLVLPYVEELRQPSLSPSQSSYLDIIDSNLQQIINPFLQNLAARFSILTPREIQIASLIKEGKTSKEIAVLIKSASRSVESHRNNIRKKLGLGRKKTNLRSFLLTLSQ